MSNIHKFPNLKGQRLASYKVAVCEVVEQLSDQDKMEVLAEVFGWESVCVDYKTAEQRCYDLVKTTFDRFEKTVGVLPDTPEVRRAIDELLGRTE